MTQAVQWSEGQEKPMTRQYGVLERYCLYLLGGYLGLFLVLRTPTSYGGRGLLAVLLAPGAMGPGPLNPQPTTLVFRFELLLALALLCAIYVGAIRAAQRGAHLTGGLRGLLAGTALLSVPLL